MDQNAKQPGIPQPKTPDALVRTSTALLTGTPDLQQLKWDCEALIVLESDPRDDNVLKLCSIFTREELLRKYQIAHQDQALNYGLFAYRLTQARDRVARRRGVDKQVIQDELKKEQGLSGAQERKRALHSMGTEPGIAEAQVTGDDPVGNVLQNEFLKVPREQWREKQDEQAVLQHNSEIGTGVSDDGARDDGARDDGAAEK